MKASRAWSLGGPSLGQGARARGSRPPRRPLCKAFFGKKVEDLVSNGIGRALKPQRCMVCFGCGYVVCDACKARGKTGGLGLAGDERGRECAARWRRKGTGVR